MADRAGWKTGFAGDAVTGIVDQDSPVHGYIINRIRDNLILLGGLRHRWRLECGARSTVYFPAVADTYEDHPEYVPGDIVIDWDTLRGDATGDDWNVNAIVARKCAGITSTITWQLIDVDASTSVVEGTEWAASTWDEETVAIPPSTGVKTYRLQIKRSTLDYGVHCVGVIELYSPAATP